MLWIRLSVGLPVERFAPPADCKSAHKLLIRNTIQQLGSIGSVGERAEISIQILHDELWIQVSVIPLSFVIAHRMFNLTGAEPPLDNIKDPRLKDIGVRSLQLALHLCLWEVLRLKCWWWSQCHQVRVHVRDEQVGFNFRMNGFPVGFIADQFIGAPRNNASAISLLRGYRTWLDRHHEARVGSNRLLLDPLLIHCDGLCRDEILELPERLVS